MAANKPIFLSDVDQTIDFTITESDQLRAAALATLQRVLCAEAVPLAREIDRLKVKFGADDARVVLLSERLEINQGFTREVEHESVRAEIGVPLVDVNTWILHGFVRDVDGKGLANLTIAPYDSVKPAAIWVKALGHVCTDDRGYFKLEASNLNDYSAAPVYLHVLNAAGATLYEDDVPLTPKGGQLNYREFAISGKTLDCPPPAPPCPPGVDLSITKTDTPDPVVAGQNVTYTLKVTNPPGASDAQNVTVTDAVPANTTFVSAAVTSGTGWTPAKPSVGGTGNVVFSKPCLVPGETAIFQIVVKVNTETTATTITNTATVTSPTTDPNAGNNTATATTTVRPPPSADLSITKTNTPDPVVAGQNVTYTLQVTNPVGASAAQSVTVTDAVPANTTFVSAAVTSGPGWTVNNPSVGGTGNVVFSKASLVPGETASFQIVVKVNTGTTATTVTNTASVTSPTTDPKEDNNTATTTTTVVSAADLSITKTGAPKKVQPDANITYTLAVKNDGPNVAEEVVVMDTLGAELAFFSIDAPGYSVTTPQAGASGSIKCTRPTLAVGQSTTITIVARVRPAAAGGTPAGSVSNTATVSAKTPDPASANNSATVTTGVIPQPVSADLRIIKTAAPPEVRADGIQVTYTLAVTNAGQSAAQNVTVTDAVPVNTTFVSATLTNAQGWTAAKPPVGGPGDVVFSKTSVASNESASFQIVVRVNPNTTGATIRNTAAVASSTTDSNLENNNATAITTVAPSADLSITKTGAPKKAAPGGDITYTLTIRNNGPNAAENVEVTDPIPANTALVSATVTSGDGWTAPTPSVARSGNVVFSKASVAAGETATFLIVVTVNKVTAVTTISNTATVASATTDRDLSNNKAESFTNVKPLAQTRVALIVFSTAVATPGGVRILTKGSRQTRVTFIDNVPQGTALAESFKGTQPTPPGIFLSRVRSVTLAEVAEPLDPDVRKRLDVVVQALRDTPDGPPLPAPIPREPELLSDADRDQLKGVDLKGIHEVIYLELSPST